MGIQFECYSDDRGRRAYSLMQPFFHHLRGGGAGVISPSDISGLAAWHRADLGVTTSASKVTSWLDQSGNGNTASNGASLGPTVTSANATFNNKATLNFAQSGTKYLQWVSQAFVGMSTGAHAFFVFNVAADPPATTAHTGFCNLGDSSDALQGTYMTFTDGVIYDDMFRSAAIGFRTVGNPTPSLTAASLYEVISTSSEWTAKVNGTQLYTKIGRASCRERV